MTTLTLKRLDALGQDTRLFVARRLAQRRMTFAQVTRCTGQVTGMYYHMKLLRDCGLVNLVRVDQRRAVYELVPEALREVARFLELLAAQAEGFAISNGIDAGNGDNDHQEGDNDNDDDPSSDRASSIQAAEATHSRF